MAQDFALRDHQEWINYLQPEGLVVSARALIDAQILLDRAELLPLQTRFRSAVIEDRDDDESHLRSDLASIVRDFLDWPIEYLDGWNGQPLPAELVYTNADLGVRIEPTWALRAKEPKEGESRWLLLVQSLPPGAEIDKDTEEDRSGWKTTPSRRFERLLRETKIPIGVIADERNVRLIFAPPQENTGTLTFLLAAMTENAGRKILGGFHALLCRERLFIGPRESRLPALLERSRKTQAAVSTALAEQVLASLYELVRGFQAADSRGNGDLLRDQLARHPDHIYQGLLNVLLRLITLLYAEDRALLPQSDLFVRNYSLRGLFERLRADAERNPDTMDHRYGAWHQLLVLFRLVESGCAHTALSMPARRGSLFDPARFSFLEGRTLSEPHVPLVPDGTVYRVLRNLLIVDGERLSYRTLDVEHIGSVYETMMGFRMERASGRAIALKPTKKGGAPTTINLEALLAEPSGKRAAWIKETAEQKVDGQTLDALKRATTTEALVAALERKIARHATPDVVAAGSMVLQPSDERRKSGSHYTPRSLTEPIVRKTLGPIFAQLGPDATEAQILNLRVCDPAMGSGAFLVEACRQLAQRLKLAWERHRVTLRLPPDEDHDLYAMRMVAQRCLYGVDKNPVAADLAKLSLWLATLARDHSFTFLDHALKCGDSLVGLDREQLESFHWKAQKQLAFVSSAIGKCVHDSLALRERVRSAPEGTDELDLRRLNDEAEAKTTDVRWIGDLVIGAFFAADADKKREGVRTELEESVRSWLEAGPRTRPVAALAQLPHADSVTPFHWWLEFPEVFVGITGGFDAIVGNPPFLGALRISEVAAGPAYLEWLKTAVAMEKGHVDLSVFFLRRSYSLLQTDRCLGLLSTNAIGFGDNRTAGLGRLLSLGATIFSAMTEMTWPGEATVVVSAVHMCKGLIDVEYIKLNGVPCTFINSRLQARSEPVDPQPLAANESLAHVGTAMGSAGFVLGLDEATSLRARSENREVIRPLTGGDEVNAPPSAQTERYVISFGNRTLEDSSRWPDVLDIVRERVLPHRMKGRDHGPGNHGKKYWWQHVLRADPLYRAIAGMARCIAMSRVSTHHGLRFESTDRIFNEKVFIFAFDSNLAFAILQSRVHETWSRECSSRHGAAINYSVTDTFMTFARPNATTVNGRLEQSGKQYHEFRAGLMLRNNEGLTKTYNHFHDPAATTPEIHRLRELHAEMDRAVLDAYGWPDIPTTSGFFPDYTETDDEGHDLPKSIRYRWPDEIRDEVLARLLALNQKRYEEEVNLGLHAKSSGKKREAKRGRTIGDMFGDGEEV